MLGVEFVRDRETRERDQALRDRLEHWRSRGFSRRQFTGGQPRLCVGLAPFSTTAPFQHAVGLKASDIPLRIRPQYPHAR